MSSYILGDVQCYQSVYIVTMAQQKCMKELKERQTNSAAKEEDRRVPPEGELIEIEIETEANNVNAKERNTLKPVLIVLTNIKINDYCVYT